MKEERSELANKIKEYRKLKSMTAQDLSEKSGINLSTIKKYETDGRKPKIEQLKKIADALDVSVYEFIDFEINSIGDVIALLNKINEATSMSYSIDDKTGKTTISFDLQELNNAVHDYALYRNDTESELLIECQQKSTSSLIKNLIMNNIKLI